MPKGYESKVLSRRVTSICEKCFLGESNYSQTNVCHGCYQVLKKMVYTAAKLSNYTNEINVLEIIFPGEVVFFA